MRFLNVLNKFLLTHLVVLAAQAVQAHDTRIQDAIENANQKLKKHSVGVCSNCSMYPTAGQELFAKLRAGRSLPKACDHLMNNAGQLGSTGKSIFNILSEPLYKKHFIKSNALSSFCPKFNSLSENQKLTAWTWFWSVLAKEESTCKLNAVHGTHFTDRSGNLRVLNPREGYGLFALERDRNYRAWRGKACSQIGTADGQARCAIDIMMRTQLSKGRSVNASMSYWGPVRRGSKQIIPQMKRLSLCY